MSEILTIAYLTPYNDAATNVVNLQRNKARRYELLQESSNHDTIDQESRSLLFGEVEECPTREATPFDTDEDIQDGRVHVIPCIKLAFRPRPLDCSAGFTFGRSAKCDIGLTEDLEDQTISRVQFRIHFNDSGDLMITNSSKYGGTQVNSNRIYSDSTLLRSSDMIFGGLNDSMAFQITIPNHSHGEHGTLWNQQYRLYQDKARLDQARDVSIGILADGPKTVLVERLEGREFVRSTVIGEGNFGIVHRVTRTRDNKVFAAKELKCSKPTTSGETTLPSEVEILSILSHRHIVQFEATRQRRGKLWVIMEYLPMGNLKDYQQHQPGHRLHANVIRSIMNQALQALEYLHERGVIHRDLKAENIMVASLDPIIKLADFGLSSQKTDAGTFCGTLGFVAPEAYQAYEHHGYYGSSIDIWALAIVMGHLNPSLFGQMPTVTELVELPHYYRNIQTWLQNRMNAIAALGKPTYGTAWGMLQSMLDANPEQRPSAAQCLQNPWLAQECDPVSQQSIKRAFPSTHMAFTSRKKPIFPTQVADAEPFGADATNQSMKGMHLEGIRALERETATQTKNTSLSNELFHDYSEKPSPPPASEVGAGSTNIGSIGHRLYKALEEGFFEPRREPHLAMNLSKQRISRNPVTP